jgi:glycosyltransferase involved in cell wall biosynthesis
MTAATRDVTLSIVIPAYCEAGNILGTLEAVARAVQSLGLSHELLVVDDGSTDGTGALVEDARVRFPGVRLLVNERNMGFGWTYRRGVQAASGSHIVMVHGDNAWGADTLRDLFQHVGDADVVIGYTKDMRSSRTLTRTIISKAFTGAVNLVTGRRLRYYNGLQVHRAEILKALDIQSAGFGFQAEVLVKALGLTHSYIEVPMQLREREVGESKAFRWKNVVDVAATLGRLWRLQPVVAKPVRKAEMR